MSRLEAAYSSSASGDDDDDDDDGDSTGRQQHDDDDEYHLKEDEEDDDADREDDDSDDDVDDEGDGSDEEVCIPCAWVGRKKPWSVNFLRPTEAPLRGRLAERVCRFAHSMNLFVRGLPAPPRVHRVPVSQLSRMRV